MPSVSSTDGNYQVYKRSVDELEDDYQKRKDRLEQKAKATESRLETNYNEATASHERSAEDATQRIRQNASDQVERSRLNERAESDRVKHEYYDRFGRSNGMEADKLKEQRDVAVSTIENLEKGHRSQLATADEEHHRKMAEGAVENERKLAEGTKTFRDSVMSSYEKSVADHKSEESRVKGEFTQKMGQNELDKIRDEKFHSSRADAAVRQAETGRQRDVARGPERRAPGRGDLQGRRDRFVRHDRARPREPPARDAGPARPAQGRVADRGRLRQGAGERDGGRHAPV